ncbi:MAG: serine/threonine-protein phosphatase [Planctomycetes bacterium]|nr:serine/threonine-protein phosphatase [Planctomycetota bacterium]
MAKSPQRRSQRETLRPDNKRGSNRRPERERENASRRDSLARRDSRDTRRDTNSRRNDRREKEISGRRDSVQRRDTGQRRAPLRKQTIPEEVIDRITRDPLFQVSTLDGLTWLDPYTGSAVPIDGSVENTANKHLQAVPSFKDQQCMPMSRLLYLRWTIDVERMIPHDPRLRLFGSKGNGWLNPFSGAWVHDVNAPDKSISRNTIAQIAAILCQCPFAAQGMFKDDNELNTALKERQAMEEAEKKAEAVRKEHAAHAESDLARAKEIQEQSMGKLPEIPNYECAAFYEGYSQVSGDFYTAIPLDEDHYFFMLGDVTGHGVQAAIIVASAMKSLRIITRDCDDLVEIMSKLNDEIKPDLLSGQFITAFGAILNTETDELSCVLAGHHQCLIVNVHAENALRRIGQRGMAMGLINGKLFQNSLRVSTVQLEEGDLLLQYTDGIIEAMDGNNEEYGHHRTAASLLTNYFEATETIVENMAEEVKCFSHNRDVGDDLTILAINIPLPHSEDESMELTEIEADTASDVLRK